MNVGSLTAFFGLDASSAHSETARLKTELTALSAMSIRNFFNMRVAAEGFAKGIQSGMKMSAEMQGLMLGMALNPFVLAIAGAAAFTAGLKKSISAAMEFEREWANVTTLMHTSQQNMNALRDDLLFLNPELGKAADLSKAMYQAISASVPSEKAIMAVTEASRFATAALTSQFNAIDVGTTVINAYGMEVEDLARVYNVLFAGIELGKTTGEELSGSLGRVIPVASALNIELEELIAVLATLTRGGLSTDEAVTSLRGALSQFLSPSKQAKDLAEDLGAELSVNAIKTRGLAGALSDLAEASEGSVEATGVFFNNVRALIGVLALTGSQADDLAEIMEKMKETFDRVGIGVEKQLDTLSKQWEILWDTTNKYHILLGTRPSDVLKNYISDLNEELAENLKLTKELIDLGVPRDIAGAIPVALDVGAAPVNFAEAMLERLWIGYAYVANSFQGLMISAFAEIFGFADLGIQKLVDDFNKELTRERLIPPDFLAGVEPLFEFMDLSRAELPAKAYGKVLDEAYTYVRALAIANLELGGALSEVEKATLEAEIGIKALEDAQRKLIEGMQAEIPKLQIMIETDPGALRDTMLLLDDYNKLIKEFAGNAESLAVVEEFFEQKQLLIYVERRRKELKELESAERNVVRLREQTLVAIAKLEEGEFAGRRAQLEIDLDHRMKVLQNSVDIEIKLEEHRLEEINRLRAEVVRGEEIEAGVDVLREQIAALIEERIRLSDVMVSPTATPEETKVATDRIRALNEERIKLEQELAQIMLGINMTLANDLLKNEIAFKVQRIELREDAQDDMTEMERAGSLARVKINEDEWTVKGDIVKKGWEDYWALMAKSRQEEEDFVEEVLNMHDQMFKTKEELAWDEYRTQAAIADLLLEDNEELTATLIRLAEIRDQKIKESSGYMIELSQRTADAIEDSFSTLFFDAFKGELDSAEDYFLAFLNSIQQAAANIMGQIMTEFLVGESGGGLGGILGGLIGGLTSLFTGGAGGPGIGSTGTEYVGPAILATKGRAFNEGREIFPMAKGGILDQAIINTPTFFPMADGLGLMGEAGPEAVMPLTRTSRGELGVRAQTDAPREDPGLRDVNVTIVAADARSFTDMMRRNPGAVVGPIVDELKAGNTNLRTAIKNTR